MDSGPSIRQLSELRKGRWGRSDCRYFITFCVNERRPVLTDAAARHIESEVLKIQTDGTVAHSTLMIMPDHVHWLFSLGDRLTLGQVIARLKAKTRPALTERGAAWQPNYFEHRLRTDEDSESYALYMFLNPYRAGLTAPTRPWPHWHHPVGAKWVFMDFLDEQGRPPAHWCRFIGKPAVG